MAERRMFAKTIIDSDAFLDMPVTARLLYYDLGMRADDDGFVNSPKKIMRTVGASSDDLSILILRKFVLDVGDGVVVIKHWRIHNYIRNDRYKETTYKCKKEQLSLDENGAYTVGIPTVYQMDTNGIPSIGKDSIDKVNINNIKHFKKPTLEELTAYLKEINSNINAEQFIDYYDANGWKVGRSPMKDWKATARNWTRNETKKTDKVKVYEMEEVKTTEEDLQELRRALFKEAK